MFDLPTTDYLWKLEKKIVFIPYYLE